MRASILVDPEKPKVSLEEVAAILKEVGIEIVSSHPDFAVVVGGDGVFSYYGRILSAPLLFVGVRSRTATGSKAYLAESYLDGLKRTMKNIKAKRYTVTECRRLEVLLDRTKLGEVFTDVSLEKGADSNALRYKLTARGEGLGFTDFIISNGVVVCTRAGSTGYFSYLDKVRLGDWLEPDRSSVIRNDEFGVCHIVPTYSKREGTTMHPLRYTLPWHSEVKIQLVRDADARLFGLRKSRGGIRISPEDVVTVHPSPNATRVMRVVK